MPNFNDTMVFRSISAVRLGRRLFIFVAAEAPDALTANMFSGTFHRGKFTCELENIRFIGCPVPSAPNNPLECPTSHFFQKPNIALGLLMAQIKDPSTVAVAPAAAPVPAEPPPAPAAPGIPGPSSLLPSGGTGKLKITLKTPPTTSVVEHDSIELDVFEMTG